MISCAGEISGKHPADYAKQGAARDRKGGTQQRQLMDNVIEDQCEIGRVRDHWESCELFREGKERGRGKGDHATAIKSSLNHRSYIERAQTKFKLSDPESDCKFIISLRPLDSFEFPSGLQFTSSNLVYYALACLSDTVRWKAVLGKGPNHNLSRYFLYSYRFTILAHVFVIRLITIKSQT